LWEAENEVEYRCAACGEDFIAVWQVAIGASDNGYAPVFGGAVVLGYGRCDTCHTDYERMGDGSWRRRRAT
jgi:hypothetical protein